MENKNLPTLNELYNDKEIVETQNKLNIILNAEPKKSWLKKHPNATVKNKEGNYEPLMYLPIERVEYLLTAIFAKYWVEVKSTQQIANSVLVTVRLWVTDPLTGKDMYNDGIGAAPLQTDKGQGAIDWNFIKSNAVQIGAPAAESYAIKDAAEKFGKIFGKDLGRRDEINVIEMLEKKIGVNEVVEVPSELITVISESDLETLPKLWNANKEYQSNPLFMQLINNRKKEINANTERVSA